MHKNTNIELRQPVNQKHNSQVDWTRQDKLQVYLSISFKHTFFQLPYH